MEQTSNDGLARSALFNNNLIDPDYNLYKFDFTSVKEDKLPSVGEYLKNFNKKQQVDPPPSGGLWDTLSKPFNLKNAATTVGIATSLAGAYLANKNYKLEKKQMNRQNAIQDSAIVAGKQAAINAGNGASYNYANVVRS